MKLGTETGSLINHIQSRAVIGQPEPVVGMGATILGWSDRHPATIIDVSKRGKWTLIKVQHDTAKRIDKNGLSEMQEYEYSPNPNGAVYMFGSKDGGKWVGVWINPATNRIGLNKGDGLRIGERNKYHDFSF